MACTGGLARLARPVAACSRAFRPGRLLAGLARCDTSERHWPAAPGNARPTSGWRRRRRLPALLAAAHPAPPALHCHTQAACNRGPQRLPPAVARPGHSQPARGVGGSGCFGAAAAAGGGGGGAGQAGRGVHGGAGAGGGGGRVCLVFRRHLQGRRAAAQAAQEGARQLGLAGHRGCVGCCCLNLPPPPAAAALAAPPPPPPTPSQLERLRRSWPGLAWPAAAAPACSCARAERPRPLDPLPAPCPLSPARIKQSRLTRAWWWRTRTARLRC